MADVKSLLRRADAATKPSRESTDVTQPNAPAVRKGEDSLSSRPFSMLRLFGVLGGQIPRENAKTEMALTGNFKKALEETGNIIQGGGAGSVYTLGAKAYLPDTVAYHEATQALYEGASQVNKAADPDEITWIAKKLDDVLFSKGYAPQFQKTAMSYLTDTIGGSLVAPPEMGELIPLMRNQSAVDRAGARSVPLPPQGKWVAPRITGPTTGYWIGENTAISESNPTTGEAAMMAKKLAVMVRLPNELFKYASASADAMIRQDVSKTLALGFDYACLYGTSGAQPKGLKFYDSSNEVSAYTASSTGTDGDTLQPQDGYKMAANIEDRNFDLAGWKWIMRPKMWGKIASFRSSSGAVTTADQLGLFVQDLTRKLGDGAPAQWCGYPVVRSAQITNALTKGSSGATLTEIWGGIWNEFLMGMYGAVEFASSTQGDSEFTNDQTRIRGILHCDCVPRYPGAFSRCSDLIIT